MDKYILVIGATGRIGRAYTSHLQKNNAKFVGVSKTGPQYRYNHVKIDFNVPNMEEIREFVSNNRINAIIHLATTNTLMNDSLEYHEKINVDSVKLFLELINEYSLNCPFIYTSTELIFNSKKEGQDEDSQDYNPLGNYAKSKLMAEKEALTYKNSIILRFGNVIGIENDFLTTAISTIKEKKTYNAWDNIYNRFTYVRDIINVLDEIIKYTGKQKIFHIACNDPPLSRYEFLKRVIQSKYRNTYFLEYLNKTSATRDQILARPEYAVLNTKITEKELNFKSRSIFDCLSRQ